MFVGRTYPLLQTITWTGKHLVVFAIMSTLPVVLYCATNYKQYLVFPWLPISLIGMAVAFYLGFKNNASYDRLWEARKLWGGIVNASRTMGTFIKGYVSNPDLPDEEIGLIRRTLFRRHIAWLHALRYQLRTPRPWEHSRSRESKAHQPAVDEHGDLLAVLSQYLAAGEVENLKKKKNHATHILDLQMGALLTLRNQNLIDDFRHVAFGRLIGDLLDLQGGCERIKNFPFPRQYASLNFYFVWIFIALLPFGLIQELSRIGETFVWLAIPFGVLLSWIFHTMERIGDYSENPFEGLNNDVPVTALVRIIEIDLLEMIDEPDIPAEIKPVLNVLM